MDKLLVALLSCCLFLGVTTLQLPHYITKCSVKDPNINTCALNSARQALPHIIKGNGDYLVPIMDPLIVNEMTVNTRDIDILYQHMQIRGLKKLDLESVRFDFHNKNITVEGRVQELNFTGNYKLSGKLLGFHVYGQGPFYIPYHDTALKYTTTYMLHPHDDGQQYMVLKDYHLILRPASISIELGNLFDGNKVLGNAFLKHINDNFQTLLSEVGEEVFASAGLILHRIFSHAASTVPYGDIFNDTE